MRSRWEGESKETLGRQADRGVGKKQNYSCDMVGGWEDRNKKNKIQGNEKIETWGKGK